MYLEIKNITKVIDGTKVLDSVTLSMERGKIYGLRGRNGSGKTMIMKAICGLIRVKEGEIWIDGELLGKKYDFPKSIGALIETPGFVENYSGFSNLKMLADMKGFIGKIAAALMEHPELIVLDEPTNALDEESVQVLHCLLQGEKDRGALIIIASHDEEELKRLCDEIYIVNAGKVKKKLEQMPEGKQNNWEEVE